MHLPESTIKFTLSRQQCKNNGFMEVLRCEGASGDCLTSVSKAGAAREVGPVRF